MRLYCLVHVNNTILLKSQKLLHRNIMYFFGYKTVFPFQINPKDLDPAYRTDLDLLDCFGRDCFEKKKKTFDS